MAKKKAVSPSQHSPVDTKRVSPKRNSNKTEDSEEEDLVSLGTVVNTGQVKQGSPLLMLHEVSPRQVKATIKEEQQSCITVRGFIRFCILVSLTFANLITLRPLFSATTPITRHRYVDIKGGSQAFNREAKVALETFHGDLFHDRSLGAVKHAKVLQIETSELYRDEVERIVKNLFDQENFDQILIDGVQSTRLASDFFSRFDPSRPLVVIVRNADKATHEVLRSFAHSMSSPVLENNGKRRSPHNVGFLLMGHSLDANIDCSKIELLEHDRDVLGWIPTILTRISDNAKVC